MGPFASVTARLDVGVVIPTFNSSGVITRALESVRQQILQPHEVVVVDDGSSDNTVEIVEEFRARGTPWTLTIIRLGQRHGPGYARNAGWAHLDTKLISFLDSDDTWHPRKLQKQIEVVHQHPKHSLFGHRLTQAWIIDRQRSSDVGYEQRVRYYGLRDFLIRNRLSTPTVMVRSSLSQRFPVDQMFGEDFALWTAVVAEGQPAVVSELKLAYIHKPAWGSAGLSAQLHEMHEGELRVVSRLVNSGSIRPVEGLIAANWMRVKYLRRKQKSADV